MEKKILIIGSSSSIGQHILKNPSFSKHQVRTTSRKETQDSKIKWQDSPRMQHVEKAFFLMSDQVHK